VLRQLSTDAAGLDPVVIPGIITSSDHVWIDASDPTAVELTDAARLVGLSGPVVQWLRDPGPSTRPRAVDDATVFVVAVPAAHTETNDVLISVAVAQHGAITAHSGDADDVVAEAARRIAAESRRHEDGLTAVVAVIDTIIDRYDDIVNDIGERQRAHSETVVQADRKTTPSSVVTAGLRLATSITDVQRQVRRLRQTVIALRRNAAPDGARATSLDSSLRALDTLDVDLDTLSHRLELTTDAQLNLISARQGEINKAIGAWAGVFAVNAVITGWYGMNILGLPGGGSWVTVAILMVSVSVALLILFRRIDWL
jgi:Mg2+ and Co2+ transporter CorA